MLCDFKWKMGLLSWRRNSSKRPTQLQPKGWGREQGVQSGRGVGKRQRPARSQGALQARSQTWFYSLTPPSLGGFEQRTAKMHFVSLETPCTWLERTLWGWERGVWRQEDQIGESCFPALTMTERSYKIHNLNWNWGEIISGENVVLQIQVRGCSIMRYMHSAQLYTN